MALVTVLLGVQQVSISMTVATDSDFTVYWYFSALNGEKP